MGTERHKHRAVRHRKASVGIGNDQGLAIESTGDGGEPNRQASIGHYGEIVTPGP